MWVITKDKISEPGEGTAVGQCSPYHYDGEVMPHKFRLLDDDGVVYYEGIARDETFSPLDDFGQPNAGATEIQYKVKGRWVTL